MMSSASSSSVSSSLMCTAHLCDWAKNGPARLKVDTEQLAARAGNSGCLLCLLCHGDYPIDSHFSSYFVLKALTKDVSLLFRRKNSVRSANPKTITLKLFCRTCDNTIGNHIENRYANLGHYAFERREELLFAAFCSLRHLIVDYGPKLVDGENRKAWNFFDELRRVLLTVIRAQSVRAQFSSSLRFWQVDMPRWVDCRRMRLRIPESYSRCGADDLHRFCFASEHLQCVNSPDDGSATYVLTFYSIAFVMTLDNVDMGEPCKSLDTTPPLPSYPCDHCGLEFQSKTKLVNHTRNKHPDRHSATGAPEAGPPRSALSFSDAILQPLRGRSRAAMQNYWLGRARSEVHTVAPGTTCIVINVDQERQDIANREWYVLHQVVCSPDQAATEFDFVSGMFDDERARPYSQSTMHTLILCALRHALTQKFQRFIDDCAAARRHSI